MRLAFIAGLAIFFGLQAVSLPVSAQDYRDELDQEIDELIPEEPAPEIYDDINAEDAAIQKEPVTVVRGKNVDNELQADRIRNSRRGAERKTEDRVLRKIEKDRLQAEQERMNRLFGEDGTPKKKRYSERPLSAGSGATSRSYAQPEAYEPPSEPNMAIGLIGGVATYPTAGNVRGGFSGGLDYDLFLGSGFTLDATFIYSNYDIQSPTVCVFCPGMPSYVRNLKQYNISSGITYGFMQGMVIPKAGVSLGYVRRNYTDRVTIGNFGSGGNSGSNAFDMGLTAGADIRASKHFMISAELRYNFNITYRSDDPLAYNNPFGAQMGTPLEEFGNLFAILGVKWVF